MNEVLIQVIKRLMGNSPWFFTVMKVIGIAVAIITGLPMLIEYLMNWSCETAPELCWQLPPAIEAFQNKVVAIASLVGTFVAQFTLTTEEKVKNNIPE